MSIDYPDLYIQFLYYFNIDRDYYECHEVLEELWLQEGRDLFYQGLLQVAVGLYHLENANQGGAKKLFLLALEKLEHYPQIWMGIHLHNVIKETKNILNNMDIGTSQIFKMEIEIVDSELVRLLKRLGDQ